MMSFEEFKKRNSGKGLGAVKRRFWGLEPESIFNRRVYTMYIEYIKWCADKKAQRKSEQYVKRGVYDS